MPARHFDGGPWGDHVLNVVRPHFERFGDVVLSRVLPVFDGIDQEARDLQQTTHRELRSKVDRSSEDYSAADEASFELAFETASDYHALMSSMKLATQNLFAAGLYHLYEQHIVELSMTIRQTEREVTPSEAVGWFDSRLGVKLSQLPSWPVIRELQRLANTVKHGEGDSARELRKLRPDLFKAPFQGGRLAVRRGRVRTPLFGQDIYVTREDFVLYHRGTMTFWDELAASLQTVKGLRDVRTSPGLSKRPRGQGRRKR